MAAASETTPLLAEVPVDHCTETSTFVVERFRNYMPHLRRCRPPRLFAMPTVVDVYMFVVS